MGVDGCIYGDGVLEVVVIRVMRDRLTIVFVLLSDERYLDGLCVCKCC